MALRPCLRQVRPICRKLLSSSSGRSVFEPSYTKFGEQETSTSPILFLHGVFGSKINFSRAAKRLSSELGTSCYLLDCRNHGTSPWRESMGLRELAGDVEGFVKRHNLGPVNLVGHSLGGKQACLVCAYSPHLVTSAVVVDMFPVSLPPGSLDDTCTALSLIDTHRLTSRDDASAQLAHQIPVEAERNFILSNLLRSKEGWRWRINLPVIADHVTDIRGYPSGTPPSNMPTLFLYGGSSNYMSPERVARARELFPRAQFEGIPNAGHIVHMDQPEPFFVAVRNFLRNHGHPAS